MNVDNFSPPAMDGDIEYLRRYLYQHLEKLNYILGLIDDSATLGIIDSLQKRVSALETSEAEMMYIPYQGVARQHNPSGSTDYSHLARWGNVVTVNFAGAIEAGTSVDDVIAENLPTAASEAYAAMYDVTTDKPFYAVINAGATTLKTRTAIGTANIWVVGQIVYITG